MEFRVLGPLEVVTERGALVLGGPKQRSVLAMLVLSANRVVSTDRLIEGVWGENAAPGAGATLQVYVSNLRGALDPDRAGGATSATLVAQRPGYLLRIDPQDIDVAQFETLITQARRDLDEDRVSQAAACLHQALGLWRGSALADLEAEPFAAAEIVRLEQVRLGALEERIEADLLLGHHHELVPELEAVVAANPLRERVWGQLMVALYRSDRQADALATYARAKRMLADELGIDPGPALREVERAILAQDLTIPPPTARTSVAPAPVRIPVPADSLIGREPDISVLSKELSNRDIRLLTLTGPGGIGKTRLALAVARQVADHFPGGVYFVELSALTDSTMMLSTIAQAIGQIDPGDADVHTALIDVLADRTVLLVLDNFEQLLDGATSLATLLRAAPKLQVLVTSRSALRIAGEHEHPMAGLAVPESTADLLAIRQAASVALFEARARALRPDFALTDENGTAVAEICRRLDGVPLAVELAAARVKTLSIDSIRARLNDSLSLLTAGSRDAPPRHRTLRATIEWSVGLLTDDERSALGRLSIFVGGFDLNAALAVCGASAESAVETLVNSSLLRLDDVGGEPRFALLETVRQYAAEQLADPAEADEVGGAFTRHFATVAEQLAAALDGPAGGHSLAGLDADHANLRAAMDLSHAHGDADTAVRIAIALAPFWLAKGWLAEGRGRLREVIAALPPGPRQAQAKIAAGRLAYQQTDIQAANELLTTALEDSDLLDGDTANLARCLLAAIAVTSGEIDAGRNTAQQALAAAATGQHYASHVVALSVLAIAAALSGDLATEKVLYTERLGLARQHGDRIRTADTLTTLAEIAFDDDDYPRARELVREAFDIADTSSRPESRDALIMLARIAVAERDVDRADELLDEALHRAVDVGQSVALALCIRVHAAAATLRGEWTHAAQLFGAAQSLHRSAMAFDLPPEPDLAASQAECRSRLGDDEFEAQHRVGAAMGLTEILDTTLHRRRLVPGS